jgi:hypothetical protein
MFPVEHPLGTNTFTAEGKPISVNSTSILNIKTHLMKSYSFLSLDVFVPFSWLCK